MVYTATTRNVSFDDHSHLYKHKVDSVEPTYLSDYSSSMQHSQANMKVQAPHCSLPSSLHQMHYLFPWHLHRATEIDNEFMIVGNSWVRRQ